MVRCNRSHSRTAALCAGLLAVFVVCKAQADVPEPAAGQGPMAGYPVGPMIGKIGDLASIKVPAGWRFIEHARMADFYEQTGNLYDARTLAAMSSPNGKLTIYFDWDNIGYVKDDDRSEISKADEILKSFKDGDAPANAERKRLGFPALHTVGWQTKPFYDESIKALSWCLLLRGEDGDEVVNYNMKVLGRRGVLTWVLACNPKNVDAGVVEMKKLLGGFEFTNGQRYSDFVSGDKIAGYGLMGLLGAGGLALAAKSGLLSQIGKFFKFIVIAVVGVVAVFWKVIRGMFGRSQTD